MATINSHSLFHMTRYFSFLKRIITDGLRYSYSLEKTDKETAIIQSLGYYPQGYSDGKLQENKLKENPQTGVAIPMICFCDIPLLRIEEHCKKYGKFAIGLDKEIISELYNNQINPIWYMESKNVYNFKKNYPKIIDSNMKILFETMSNKDVVKNKDVRKMFMKKFIDDDPKTKVLANYLLGYTKERQANKILYDDEREWRALLPDAENIASWMWDVNRDYFKLHKKEWNDLLDNNKEYGHMVLISEVIDRAITHIIVDTDKRIPDAIQHVMKTKTIFGVSDISYEQRLFLVSKITSFQRINQDF